MDCSTPGLPVHHQLPELAQAHVHRVGDAIQLSHPLSSPTPPAFNLSQHQDLFKESVLHIRWPKYHSFSFSISPSNEYSDLISFRIDWFDLLESPLDCKEIQPVHSKGNQSEYSLEGLMLKLKRQYFGHLMGRTDSLEKTLMLGKIEARRRRGEDEMVGWHHRLDGHEFK